MQDNNIIQDAINCIKRLDKENAELKEKIIKLSEEKGHLIVENNTLKEENFNFEEIVKLCRCEQYKQTLQEIKAISEKFIKNVSEDCINITPMFLVHKEILQKIAEAEEE